MAVESILTKTPQNTNFLQATKYTFVIPTLPFAKYFCQSVNFPGVSTNEIMIPSPLANTYRHGEKLSFEPLTLNVLIDEDLRVWEETYNWLVMLTKPSSSSQYGKNVRPYADLYHDGFLTVNTNANNPNLRFKFRDCHPVSLGGINFNSADNAENVLSADITFRYDIFDIERI